MFATLRRWLGLAAPASGAAVAPSPRKPSKAKSSTALRLELAAVRAQLDQEDHAKAPRWK